MDAPEHIQKLVREGLPKLPPSLREWTKEHVIEPKKVSLCPEPDGGLKKELWLVTDHTGNNDSSCRVVFDENERAFGLECTLDTGIEWFMGLYEGDFADVIENM